MSDIPSLADKVSKQFDAADADIVFRSKASQQYPAILYKLKKADLVRTSTFFSNMFEVANASDSDEYLPMDEESKILDYFFSFFSSDVSGYCDVKTMPFNVLLRLWQLCKKYQVPLAEYAVENQLKGVPPMTITHVCHIDLRTRGSQLDDDRANTTCRFGSLCRGRP